MRTSTVEERSRSRTTGVANRIKIEIQDADGTWRDWSHRIVGPGTACRAHRDDQVSTARFSLARGTGESSLAPTMAMSLLNRDAAGNFAPAIDKSRGVRVWTATVAAGFPATAGDFREVFTGRINEVGYDQDPIPVSCSDLGAWMMDKQIREEATYGSPGGTALQTVMQDMIDANPNGKTLPVVYTPVDPLYFLTEHTVDTSMLMPALLDQALKIGGDFRYRYDSFHVSRPTFLLVDRARVDVDETFETQQYFRIEQLKVAIGPIRNNGRQYWRDSSGVQHYVEYENPTSVADDGDRYFQIPEQEGLDTEVENQTMINAAGSDLSGPGAEKVVFLPYCWWVQIHDRYAFKPNYVHFDTTQTMAVAGYSHDWDEQLQLITTLTGTERIVGAYDAWSRRLSKGAPGAPGLPAVRLRAMVQANRTVNLYALIAGAAPANFPVTLDVYENDPTGASLFTYVYLAANGDTQEVGPTGSAGTIATDPALTGRAIGQAAAGKRWYARITDAVGNVDFAFAMADPDPTPGGAVTLEDFRASPVISSFYDDDTTSITVTCPDGIVKTFAALGIDSGYVTYVRGATPRDDASLEAVLAAEAVSGTYTVRAHNAAVPAGTDLWSGQLHGLTARAPVLEPRVVIATNKATADGYAIVRSPIGELVTLQLKESEGASPVIWTLCVGAADSTTRYVAGGTELGPADYFTDGASRVQKLAAVTLVRDAIIRRYLQAVGKDSALTSGWTPVTFDQRGTPWLESIDVVFDEATDTLKLTAVGGANVVSARFEIADNTTFTAPLENVVSALADGAAVLLTTAALIAGQRNKVWYARVTPYNAAAGGGLAGVPQRDTVSVSASETGGIEAPRAWLLETANSTANVQFALEGALGAGATGPLEWQTKEWTDVTTEPAWSGVWQTSALPGAKTVTRAPKWGKHLRFRTRDADGRITEAFPAYIHGHNEFVADDGRPRRAQEWDDSGYAVQASDSAGVVASASVQDSRLALMNDMHRRSVDTADQIIDGASRRTASVDYTDSTGRPTGITTTDGGVGTTFGKRQANSAVSEYRLGITSEFKDRAALSAPGTATYGVLVTERPYNDNSGGHATQTFKSADGQWKREAPAGATLASEWSSWRAIVEVGTQRLDRTSGHATSTMQDSRLTLLNQHFDVATQTADSINAGASRTTASVAYVNTSTGQVISLFDAVLAQAVTANDINVGQLRARTGLNADGEITQDLPATIGQYDGISTRVLAKGHISGSCRHADPVSFPTNFQNVPIVLIRGGINYEPRSKWGSLGSGIETNAVSAVLPQYDDVAALDLSVSGFTMRARLRQKSGSTARAHQFAANSLTSAGTSVARNLDNAPANNDTYSVNFSVAITANAAAGFQNVCTAVVAIEVDDGSGIWVERATRTYAVTARPSSASDTWAHESVPVVVAGLIAGDDIRIKVKSWSTGAEGGSLAVHGFSGAGGEPVGSSGVTYSTSADNYASKTPDADDHMYWEAWEGS